MNKVILLSLSIVALLTTGCVTKEVHEATLQELGKTKDSLVVAQKTIDEQDALIKSNNEEIARSKSELSDLDLKKLALQKELDTLRRIEAETKKRNEIYASFVNELQKMIDGGQLTVSIEGGRLVINLPENVLFASASAIVNPEGTTALTKVANALKKFSDRRFQIEGHTDNVPINSSNYPSNWELSTARALSVVHLMIKEGVEAKNVSAAGFGEFHPRSDNATDEGKALNRRIEIIMQPNLDILSNELPKVVQ